MPEPLTSLIKPSKPAAPDLGDVLYGQEWIHRWWKPSELEGLRFVSLAWRGSHYWLQLMQFVNIGDIVQSVTYKCPFITGNRYYWVYPLGILIFDEHRTYPIAPSLLQPEDIVHTIRANSSSIAHVSVERLMADSVALTLTGHGYTFGTLPSDGSNCRKLASLLLENGDHVLALCWQWYNK